MDDREEFHYSKGPWSSDYQVINKKGLVLKNIKAGNELLYDSISVPQFKINYGSIQSVIIKFCDSSKPKATLKGESWHSWDGSGAEPTDFSYTADLKTIDVEKGIDRLTWTTSGDIESNGLKGSLEITYEIIIRYKEVRNCEVTTIECYRLIPKVTYEWNGVGGSPTTLIKFAAFYKLDGGPNWGITLIKDNPILSLFTNIGRQSIIPNEKGFLAVKNGQAGQFDNIHAVQPGNTVFIPGCIYFNEYGCAHMHWNWAGFADPLVEPSDDTVIDKTFNGTPYLVPGQTIAVAVVKSQGGEDPNDPSSLLDGEQIATVEDITTPVDHAPVNSGPEIPCIDCMLVKAEVTVTWYVASIPNEIATLSSDMDYLFWTRNLETLMR